MILQPLHYYWQCCTAFRSGFSDCLAQLPHFIDEETEAQRGLAEFVGVSVGLLECCMQFLCERVGDNVGLWFCSVALD